MGKVGGSGLVLFGIVLVLVGFLLQSNLIEWLLDIIGVVIIVSGVILSLAGLVKMISGSGRSKA